MYTYTRMYNTDVQMDEGDGTRRGGKRTAWRARRRIGREVAGDEGDDEKKRERGCTICMYVRMCVCVLLGACQCARAQEQRKVRAERNTEKTLVKGKRPLCLPFQSNPPPLSPLSFSLCPRFGSSCSLPAKPSLLPPPLSFARSLFSSPSLSLSPFFFLPLPGFLFVLPLRLTCA